MTLSSNDSHRLIQIRLMEGVSNENRAKLSSQASPNFYLGPRLARG